MLSFFAILITISAFIGYINHKWLRLPNTIGVMLISVVIGVVLKFSESLNAPYIAPFRSFLTEFDFSTFVLNIVLCFLLFSAGLQVNLRQLKGARATVFFYSTIGVVISTIIIGTLTYLLLTLFGYEVFPLHCLLFGAIISPTDPIAVTGILSKYAIPQKLKMEIVGESLFNDGIAVVLFTLIFLFISGDTQDVTTGSVFGIFCIEVLGGIGIGLATGYGAFLMMKTIDHYHTEIMVTLAVVTGGYSLCSYVHASGPLAMVVAGLIIGNAGKTNAMSDITAENVDKFWELIDEICNTLLFVLMGLEIFLVPYDPIYVIVGIILIVIALFARLISLLPAFFIFNRRDPNKVLNLAVLTWGGLRGGVSIALVLSLGNSIRETNLFIICTYSIVLFSILVQGLSMKNLLKRYENKALS